MKSALAALLIRWSFVSAFAHIILTSVASAEVLLGIPYSATLGEVKARYPNAVYEKVNAAWVTPNEAFIRITGRGLSGITHVCFDDARPSLASYSDEQAIALLSRLFKSEPTPEEVSRHVEASRRLAKEGDDDALKVAWVRWAPDKVVPKRLAEQRYGKASCDYDESFELVCKWPNRALVAKMTDDGKSILYFETDFTPAERRAGMLEK